MKSEDSFYIHEMELYFRNNGKNVIYPHVVERDPEYFKGAVPSKRYVIMSPIGIHNHTLYSSLISIELPQAQQHLNTTRRYAREVDSTYFKYYDDAEEVMNNIISFIKWIKDRVNTNKARTMNEVKAMDKMRERCIHLIRDRFYTDEEISIKDSMVGRDVLLRSKQSSVANLCDLL